jgi:hypothetical protein
MLAHAGLLNTSAVFWEVVLAVIESGDREGRARRDMACQPGSSRGSAEDFSWQLHQAVYNSDEVV